MKNKSLKFKLITGGLFIVILPMITIGFFSVKKASESLMDAGRSQAMQVAQDLNATTELFLEQTIKITELMAENPIVIDVAEAVHRKGIEATFAERDALNKIFSKKFKRSGSGYELFFMADATGLITVDSMGGLLTPKNISVADRDYFKAAKAGKTRIIGTPILSKASGSPVFVSATPLKTRSGEFAGMIATAVKFSTIADILGRVKLGIPIYWVKTVFF